MKPVVYPDISAPLRSFPLWQPEDLGKPMPDSVHAVSVAMPLWEHVIGYEERRPEVMAKLACGYPRFVFHPLVQQVMDEFTRQFATPEEQAFIFPSEYSAQRAVEFVKQRTGVVPRVCVGHPSGVHVVIVPRESAEHVKAYWQHFGEIVSSRWCLRMIEGAAKAPSSCPAKDVLRERLAVWYGVPSSNVFLFPTGMAAFGFAHRVLKTESPGKRTAQFGFPYVDGCNVQAVLPPGVFFLPKTDAESVSRLTEALNAEPFAGIFTEFPSNPLLDAPDVALLASLAERHGVPVVIDDTLSTPANVDLTPFADLIVTSLTKYISGVGDVMGGALIVSAGRARTARLLQRAQDLYEDLFYDEDAYVLERNSRNFLSRMQHINTTAETVCDRLKAHPAIAHVAYPKYTCPASFERVLRSGGGYAGLFSFVLKNPADAAAVYNRLRMCKGPSLGNNFSLVCPYTLLAHYNELDWAEKQGVSRYLLRVSIGLEHPEDLIARFEEALHGGM